jgi:hypothetical protein
MKWAALAAAAVVSAWAVNASASTVIIDFTGSVITGTDGDGLFGPTGADLSGDAFAASFDFNDPDAPDVNLPGIIQSASLTIHGVTQIAPVSPGPLSETGDYGTASVGSVSQVGASTTNDDFSSNATFPLDAFLISTNTSVGVGEFTVTQEHPVIPGEGNESGSFYLAGGATFGTLDPETATVFGALPEPSNWILLILGFGMTGGFLRLRSSRIGIGTLPIAHLEASAWRNNRSIN